MSCGVGCRRSSGPALLWLWCRPETTAPIRSLVWEPPYAVGAAQEIAKKKKKILHVQLITYKSLFNPLYTNVIIESLWKKYSELFVPRFLNIYTNSSGLPFTCSYSDLIAEFLSSPNHRCSPSLICMKNKQYHSLALPHCLQKAHTLWKIFWGLSLL